MGGYIVRRLISAVPVLFLVTLISFSVMFLIPGDPASAIAGLGATPEEVEQVRHALGLDKPFHVRLLAWYGGLFRGDLGQSILLGRSVTQAIIERLPVTFSLAAYSLVLTLLLGLILGIIASIRQNTWIDQLSMTFALLGVSLPNFWLALMLIYLFSVKLGWFPTGGYVPLAEDPVGWFKSLTLPAISLSLMQIGLLARMTRSSMLEVLGQDFVRTARAKGLSEQVVVGKHALKNVMIPMVTVVGIIFTLLLSGTVVVETVYSLPGIGRLIVNGVLRRDYPVIQGGLLLTAAWLILINLVVDLLYAFLDPRVRYDRAK